MEYALGFMNYYLGDKPKMANNIIFKPPTQNWYVNELYRDNKLFAILGDYPVHFNIRPTPGATIRGDCDVQLNRNELHTITHHMKYSFI